MMVTYRGLFTTICIAVGLAAALLLVSAGVLTVHAGCPGPAGEPCGNGDVNGDGDLDIADAVFLLSHLFGGGQAPASIPCDPCNSCCPPPEGCFPATGQTVCYDTAGNVIACDSEALPGQDGFHQAGCPNEGRFVDNGDGTVTDNHTVLTWQQTTADVNGDGSVDGNNDRVGWAEALRYCENLVLCGDGTWLSSTQLGWAPDPEETDEHGGILWDDWRLPNILELRTLAKYDAPSPPACLLPYPWGDPEINGNWGCWSSTTVATTAWEDEKDKAWAQGFAWGITTKVLKRGQWRVRAVRGGL